MYTREQAKAITDKVIDMAKGADAVEVTLNGGERSGTRWANSTITTNLVQYNRQVNVNVRIGSKTGNSSTDDFSDSGFRKMVDDALAAARSAQDSPNLPELLGPQEYIPVDSALPDMVNYGPAERARMVKTSSDISEEMGVLGAGYIPKNDQTNCTANSKGLFAYYRSADMGFVLTCRMPDGSGSGFAAISGVKDLKMVDPAALTRDAAGKALRSRNGRALEPGRYTVILEPRASARFLSLVTGIFSGGGGGRGGGGGGMFGDMGGGGYLAGKKVGDKVFSDGFTLKSDIGNQILRQSPIGPGNRPAAPVTWVENGILKAVGPQSASTNQSLVQGGTNLTVDEMVRQTRRGLLVTSLWYIRGVPSTDQPLLNTGMTRDGLFLIENGEIVGPVQNFRWNMSPLVAYNNLTLVGSPVPMLLGESFDSSNAALVPPVRIEEFYMTSISPAV